MTRSSSPRLPYLDKDQIPAEFHGMFRSHVHVGRMMLNSPKTWRAFMALVNTLRSESRLDPRLRELATLQVGWDTRSPYEYSHHIKNGRELGVTDEDLRGIAAESTGKPSHFDPLAKAVIKAASEMTLTSNVSDETYASLEKQLAPDQILDLFVTIGLYNGFVRVIDSLKIEVEDSYRKYLYEFPLPVDQP